MANNCLVTKLKGVVDNDNLSLFGAITVGVTEGATLNSANSIIGIQGNGTAITVTPLNGQMVATSDPSYVYDELVVTTNTVKFLVKPVDSNLRLIKVKSKYDVTRFTFGNAVICNLDDLAYCHLTTLGNEVAVNKNTVSYGTLSVFLKNSKSTISMLKLLGMNISGSVADLYDCLNLAYCTSDIEGDWYQLAVQQNAKGRTTGDIIFAKTLKGSFNGHSISANIYEANETGHLVWNGSKVYVTGTSAVVMCIGYSDSEITTNIATGGIWAGKTAIKCD